MKEKLQKYDIFLICVAIVLISTISFCTYNFFLAIIFLVILLSIILYQTININKENDKASLITSKIKLNINDNISDMSYPIALIHKNGEIVWGNKKFKKELSNQDIEEQSILSIARNLDLQKLLKCDKDLKQRVKIKEGFYSVYANQIKYDEDNLYIVYFIEVSNLRDLYATKESVVLIEVDNLSEALERTEENNRPMLVAEVEKTINTYGQKLKAMIVKYESNKYVLSVQDKYINDEINCKFDILEKISSIDIGNKLEVTLSIGIGRGGVSPQENYNFAVTAKELALGRGGDQVVVKNNDKIHFFGGNTREVEKRTRVRARVISQAIKELIFESSNVFIIGHKNPDMDCLGASVGLWTTIKQLGKNCNIILEQDINAIEYYLEQLKKDSTYDNMFITGEEAEKYINDKSLLIIVDVHNKGYVKNIDLVEKINRKIIIDHHRRSADIIEGALLNYIEVYASSTSEMVTEIIQYILNKPMIKPLEAEGLLAGIVMDTKGFQFKSGVRTFDAASFLRELGADTLEVKKMFADSFEDYLIIAETIKNAEIENNIAIAVCPNFTSNTVIVARAADELLNISGIDVCFVLSESNGSVAISGRSIGDVNVQIVLEEIGGGGHINMAGAKLHMQINEAVSLLKESIARNLK
ncbi:MAG: DHH family phosphoesterase [Clostridium sp.]|nr:DHH family phosphoesterase [Clostridium sp.]